MKINEIICKRHKAPVLNEGARIMHAEDLVFFEGSPGALRAANSIIALFKNRDTLSIKWDGSVAIVAGRNDNGQFIMTDKAGFTAKGYNGLYKSAKEFAEQKRSKGTAEDYLAKIAKLWPIVEAAFPKSFRGYILGDVMWFPGELTDTGRKYVFTPNTVTYEIAKNSELGFRIAKSKAGFAIHTFFAEPGAIGQALSDTSRLNAEGPLCILGPEIKNEAPLQADKMMAKQIIQAIRQKAKDIDSFLDGQTLSELKMASLPEVLYTYVNARTKQRDHSQLSEKFLPWVQSNPKFTKVMVQKISDYVLKNNKGLRAVFDTFDMISKLKLDVITQLDMHDGDVVAHIAGTRGGEGYVNTHPDGPIKLVNRIGFSATNASNNNN